MSDVIVTVGLDLAKNVFQVHGVDAYGRVCVRRKLRRSEVATFLAIYRLVLSEWRLARHRTYGRARLHASAMR
jgi:hypothetical protein